MAPRRTVESECKRAQQILKITALAKRGGTAGERQAAEAALERLDATPTDIAWAEVLASTKPAPAAKPRRTGSPGTPGKRPMPLTAAEICKRKREGRYHDGRKPLSVKGIAKLKGAGKYHDGGPIGIGLYLQITATGARSWLFRYEIAGREHQMGLGSFTAFDLAQARERARAARRLVEDGIDPIATKHATKAAAATQADQQITFAKAVDLYVIAHQAAWSVSHAAQFKSSLKTYAIPIIGALDVAVITTPHVQSVLNPIWSAGRSRLPVIKYAPSTTQHEI